MKKQVVFIMGSGHCGSTLLTLMLGSHPDCFGLGELNSLPIHYKMGLPLCGICKEKCSFWDELNPKELKSLTAVLGNTRLNKYVPLKLEKTIRKILRQDQVFKPYSYLFSKLKENILIDSSKGLPWIKQKINATEFSSGDLEGYLIHLVRDGRAVVSSYLRRFKSLTVETCAEGWRERTIQKNEFYDQFPDDRKILVRYEKLATEPEKTLATICELLGIDFTQEMIRYWQGDHHVISGNSGVRSLIWKNKKEEIEAQLCNKNDKYYDNVGSQIKLDLRWKEELSKEQEAVFNQIAGDINKPYEWN